MFFKLSVKIEHDVFLGSFLVSCLTVLGRNRKQCVKIEYSSAMFYDGVYIRNVLRYAACLVVRNDVLGSDLGFTMMVNLLR